MPLQSVGPVGGPDSGSKRNEQRLGVLLVWMLHSVAFERLVAGPVNLALDPSRCSVLKGDSISNVAFCTLSNVGLLIDLLMCLHRRIEEKGDEVGNVSPLAQSFLVSISS
jgi:hypothetical protein